MGGAILPEEKVSFAWMILFLQLQQVAKTNQGKYGNMSLIKFIRRRN